MEVYKIIKKFKKMCIIRLYNRVYMLTKLLKLKVEIVIY